MSSNCQGNCGSCKQGDTGIHAIPLELLPKKLRIALAGNPNTGKTTLFNTLTGMHQKTANYAGVTVDMKKGSFNWHGCDIDVFDLPGTYSLSAYSPDEVVTRDFILDEKPDIVISVLDSTNLERNLMLCLQLSELGIPILGALNMDDEAQKRGIVIDSVLLTKLLGIPFVKIAARSGHGIDNLLETACTCSLARENREDHKLTYGNEVEAEIVSVSKLIALDTAFCKNRPARFMAAKLIEKDDRACEVIGSHKEIAKIKDQVGKSIARIELHFGTDSEIIVSQQRYAFVRGAVAEAVTVQGKNQLMLTRAVDKVLLNRIVGLPVFLVIMWAVFQITFSVGSIPAGWLQSFFTYAGVLAQATIPAGLVQSLIVDGLLGGIGGVLSFVPLIMMLFLLISILEDTGYMARAAFQMDKFLHIFGLHGQSFLPLVTGFGCSVPAFMAARTLRSPKDRIATILSVPFMSCGAKLPVYVLLAGAFFERNAGTVVMLVYLCGILLAFVSALVFRKTVLKGEATPFVMELPPYRLPTLRGIMWHVWDKSISYLQKAGTVLLAASLIIWALVTFPLQKEDVATVTSTTSTLSTSNVNHFHKKASIENSYAGKLGKVIEPAIRSMGFDWKIGISVITGFAAKEAVVSTLGILYRVNNTGTDEAISLKNAIKNDVKFTPLLAFVLMLFMLIMPPCIAALSTIRAEIGWGWLGFHLLYNTSIAWGLCTLIYQVGIRVM